MDAKAKVVVWLIEFPGGLKYPATDKRIADAAEAEGITVTPLIPLTDHEAALAEQSARIADMDRQIISLLATGVKAIEERDTLLTGLEALAGEWKARVSKVSLAQQITWDECADELLRTLASSATGEKNTEEETKL